MRKKKTPVTEKLNAIVMKLRKTTRSTPIAPVLIASVAVAFIMFQVGSADGYQRGYSNGVADGFTDGRSEGYSAGKTEGISIGYSQGQSAGEKSGYSKGYVAACKYVFDFVDYDADFITAYNPYNSWNRYPSGYYISKSSACANP